MANDHREDGDNEPTRIVQRPGPRQIPVNIGQPVAPPPPPANARPAPVAPAPAFAAPIAPTPIAPTPVAPPPLAQRPATPAPSVDDPDVTRVAPRAGAPAVVAPVPVRPVLTPPARPVAPSPVQPRPLAPGPSPFTPAAVVPQPAPVAAAPQPAPVEAPRVMAPKAPMKVEPVVGWLVVIKGPGRGASREIVKGRNSLGTDADQIIMLDFGDPAIAARGHAFIVYDEEGREFVIEDGKQKEVVRLNGRLLTETRALSHGDDVRIGATTLRFIALCGPGFDWSDEDRPKPAASPETMTDEPGDKMMAKEMAPKDAMADKMMAKDEMVPAEMAMKSMSADMPAHHDADAMSDASDEGKTAFVSDAMMKPHHDG